MEQAAVVILNYNGIHFLKKFLPSVTRYSGGHRLIVADNGSTDQSVTFLREHYPEVEIMAFSENHGFAKGYDEALKRIGNKYCILLNSDVEVTANWIDPVIDFMEKDDQIAACQPKIRDYHRKEYFEHAGAAGGFVDIIGYPFCRGRILDTIEQDNGQYDDIREVFWGSGACFFVRTSYYLKLGGFDAAFHAHMEEIDLCWRINKAGYKIYYHPDSMIYHVGGGTMPVTNPRKTYLNFRNSTVMLYKNAASSTLWWKLPLKICVDGIAAFRFLLAGRVKDSSAVMKAVIHFFKDYEKWQKSRTFAQSLDKKITPRTIYPGLLVVARYFVGKKRFSDLNF